MAPPPSFFEQPLEILTSCSHECLTIHPPQATQTVSSHSVPLFSFGKEGFDPNTSFSHRFLVRFCHVIASDTFKVLFSYMTTQFASCAACCALCFERTGIADARLSSVLQVL